MRAFIREFPNAKSKGCMFHLGQSIYRQIQENGLARKYGIDVEFSLQMRMLGALAFLPESEVEAAFFLIKPIYPDEAKPVLDWFEATYMCWEKNGGEAKRHERIPFFRHPYGRYMKIF